MKIESAKILFFSPTGTSKKVAKAIVSGFTPTLTEIFDITSLESRTQPINFAENELLIIAVPVYMGRVPAVLGDYWGLIRASNTPTVCVVVYGNRAYEDALLELKNIAIKCGCIPIAGAAYIGEHSFSSLTIPTAHGRPDEKDISHAEIFGQKIRKKIESISSISVENYVEFPGEYPYRGETKLWDVDFIHVNDKCSNCHICAKKCPVGAIDLQDSSTINHKKCILCCACIKKCPEQARTIKVGPVKDASIRLNMLFSERKEPELFLNSDS